MVIPSSQSPETKLHYCTDTLGQDVLRDALDTNLEDLTSWLNGNIIPAAILPHLELIEMTTSQVENLIKSTDDGQPTKGRIRLFWFMTNPSLDDRTPTEVASWYASDPDRTTSALAKAVSALL